MAESKGPFWPHNLTLESIKNSFEEAPKIDGLELKQLLFVHRHGEQASTALHATASPPRISEFKFLQGTSSDQPLTSEWSKKMILGKDEICETGQLTDTGKLRLKKLGEALRKEYAGFIPEHLNGGGEDVYIRSSGYVRTIESVQYLMDGLYPKEKREPGPGGNVRVHIRAVGNM
ncbi:hypothetical protein HDU97_006067 [Phlyctochytrium planicorne]|nr:hypothetical protein HDU97_006067 [Phlyctochytrium planicorne]